MKSINIQFHMLPTELLSLVDDVRRKYVLDVELEAWSPHRSKVVTATESLVSAVEQFGETDRYWFIVKKGKSNGTDKLMLNAPTFRGKRLNQADFGAGAKSPEGQEILKGIAEELRSRTSPGVWVVGEFGGVSAFAKSFRISKAAAAASRSGEVELSGIGFVQRFYPDKPCSEASTS